MALLSLCNHALMHFLMFYTFNLGILSLTNFNRKATLRPLF